NTQAKINEQGVKAKVGMQLKHSVAGAMEKFGGDHARKRLFSEIHAGFGGKLRLFVSGGAALDPEDFHFFRKFGITIVEGYGLTETAPILTVNPIVAPKPGSVGLALPGVELKIQQPDVQGVGEI